ncbi:Hypothetical_protein [Hexamita inflata]|uniref:Hypothetical_protein n=1 Tax=Hexamita inflata TaxID=28002 RepID=A0AA86U9R9_9EUKA|nr:Hypothetical protein HINF_LOCUS34409 [Hexamita inflata]
MMIASVKWNIFSALNIFECVQLKSIQFCNNNLSSLPKIPTTIQYHKNNQENKIQPKFLINERVKLLYFVLNNQIDSVKSLICRLGNAFYQPIVNCQKIDVQIVLNYLLTDLVPLEDLFIYATEGQVEQFANKTISDEAVSVFQAQNQSQPYQCLLSDVYALASNNPKIIRFHFCQKKWRKAVFKKEIDFSAPLQKDAQKITKLISIEQKTNTKLELSRSESSIQKQDLKELSFSVNENPVFKNLSNEIIKPLPRYFNIKANDEKDTKTIKQFIKFHHGSKERNKLNDVIEQYDKNNKTSIKNILYSEEIQCDENLTLFSDYKTINLEILNEILKHNSKATKQYMISPSYNQVLNIYLGYMEIQPFTNIQAWEIDYLKLQKQFQPKVVIKHNLIFEQKQICSNNTIQDATVPISVELQQLNQDTQERMCNIKIHCTELRIQDKFNCNIPSQNTIIEQKQVFEIDPSFLEKQIEEEKQIKLQLEEKEQERLKHYWCHLICDVEHNLKNYRCY